jgi:hypothetical protein
MKIRTIGRTNRLHAGHIAGRGRRAVAGCLWTLIILWACQALQLNAQMNLGAQASAAFVKSGGGSSQYAYNGGRGTFTWRGDLFATVLASEHITFQSTLRLLPDQILHVDLFSVRFADVTPLHLSMEAGEIELPVGNLAERRFPMKNPFLDLPLINEHLTALRSSDYQLWPYDARYTSSGIGVRILDQGLYDRGAKLSGTIGILEYTLALINGTVSATSTYSAQGLSASNRLGKIVRLAGTPMIGLTVGVSYADGVLSTNQLSASYTGTYPQHLVESDVEYSWGYFSLFGQAVYNQWGFQELYGNTLVVKGISVEGTYKLLPRMTIAARAGGMLFSTIEAELPGPNDSSVYYSGRWDHDVVRLEAALSYRLSRESLLKFVYEWNRTAGLSPDAVEQLVAVQTVISF